jgi:hypothetical protein
MCACYNFASMNICEAKFPYENKGDFSEENTLLLFKTF